MAGMVSLVLRARPWPHRALFALGALLLACGLARAQAANGAQKPFTVAVIGDSFAQSLSAGLTEACPPGQGVAILSRSRDNSGLVRDDLFDWPKAMRELVDTSAPDVLVVMIGSNDRQPLRGPNGLEEPLSAGWEALYGRRIEALLTPAKDKRIPILMVGFPIMKNERYSLDMGAINEIERARAEALGARFIDVFDAFADEKGAYNAFGPDVNGQIVKLRGPDGVHFTPSGARKLAHFVETDLRHLLENARPHGDPTPAVANLPPADPPASPGGVALPAPPASASAAPAKSEPGAVLSLTAQPTSPGGALLSRSGGQGRWSDAERARIEEAAHARAGRASPSAEPRP